ncbi:MAG: hypothetical protein F4X40_03280 [Chloroflexi bacterium]|nr:hypothetical protein [Chloroflexota bacterium]
MIIVIQCAAGKQDHAGHLQTRDGRNVMFVAKPDAAPANTGQLFARPDDVSDTGKSWRTVLHEYSAAPGANLLGLLPAWRLYRNPAYRMLADHCGTDCLYILSAGWGLIRADFLTPDYDITFSSDRKVEPFKRRDRREVFEDFSLPPGIDDDIVFFGGRGYIPLFCRLTANVQGARTIFYAGNTLSGDVAPGCRLRRYERRFTNWHYQCARHYVEGRLPV